MCDPDPKTDDDPNSPAGRFSSAEVWESLNRSEDGDAAIFIRRHRGLFLYDTAAARWYAWNGNQWVEDYLNDALRCIGNVVDIYIHEMKRIFWRQRKELSDDARKN